MVVAMGVVSEKVSATRPSSDWIGLSETLLLQILAAGLLFGMHLVAARLLPVESYGALTFGLTIAGLMMLFCSLGYPNLVLRQVASAVAERQWGLLKGITLQAGTAVAWASLLAALVLSGIATLRWSANPGQALGLSIAAAAVAFYPLGFLRAKLARALGSIRCSIVPEDVVRPLSFIVLLFVAVPVMGLQLAGTGLLAVFCLSLCMAVAGGLHCLRQHVPFAWQRTNAEHRPAEWRAASRRMLAGGVFQEVLARSDLIALGFLATMTAAAEYSAASKLALLNVFVLKVIDTYYAPRMAVAYQSGNRAGLKELVMRTAMLSLAG
ncbi:MAG: oligosaccharide flippase family protein, partial [Gammaproteobacteria bacterium]|nr:oligosaccharide flippase family protein [Gammaproteobacteria bacterium]